jgi:hypothetical protein
MLFTIFNKSAESLFISLALSLGSSLCALETSRIQQNKSDIMKFNTICDTFQFKLKRDKNNVHILHDFLHVKKIETYM